MRRKNGPAARQEQRVRGKAPGQQPQRPRRRIAGERAGELAEQAVQRERR
jgi:hypothetical protein